MPCFLVATKRVAEIQLTSLRISSTPVAVFTLAAASIFARYITGDPTKQIKGLVIPAIIGSLVLIGVGIWLRIKLDETK